MTEIKIGFHNLILSHKQKTFLPFSLVRQTCTTCYFVTELNGKVHCSFFLGIFFYEIHFFNGHVGGCGVIAYSK